MSKEGEEITGVPMYMVIEDMIGQRSPDDDTPPEIPITLLSAKERIEALEARVAELERLIREMRGGVNTG